MLALVSFSKIIAYGREEPSHVSSTFKSTSEGSALRQDLGLIGLPTMPTIGAVRLQKKSQINVYFRADLFFILHFISDDNYLSLEA